jgi:exoribonuclease R
MLLKVHIDDRNYSSWKWYDGFTLESVESDKNPLTLKMFSDDVIEVNDNGNEVLIHSSIRQMKYMPGILLLTGKTFGRHSANKLIYQCIPDDKRMPIFLIPYELKPGFNKNPVDIYVTFTFVEWTNKHPTGKLTNNLGKVSELNNFYEYQLYCKSLNASIQDFTKKTTDALKQRTEAEFIQIIMETHPQIQDRTYDHILSIDPFKSLDIDDAVGIKIINNNTNEDVQMTPTEAIVSIYIANVAVWMDTLNLWNSFSERISTIYLPDRKRPMLPNILSDCLCSLQEQSKRFAYHLDVKINLNSHKIINIEFGSSLIKVFKNYRYETEELLRDDTYKKIFELLQSMSREHKLLTNIKDSHDVIAYLALLINKTCADKMCEFQNGIYRTLKLNSGENSDVIPQSVPDDIIKFLKIWRSSSGQYSTFNDQCGHSLVNDGVDAYITVSSPIRRLVDLLNSIKLQENLGILNLSQNAIEFYNKWLDRLGYINMTSRAIRKVQSDCTILDMISRQPDMTTVCHEGYVFDRICRNDGLFQYIVYLNKLKIVSRITVRNNIEDYEKVSFKIFLFNDENTLKKKIRLQMLYE